MSDEHDTVFFGGERLGHDHARLTNALWIKHGVPLGLAFGDCVAIARTALVVGRVEGS